MPPNYYIGAYWGPRKETAGQCARRIVRLLDDLGSLSPILSKWYRKGRSRNGALQFPVPPNYEAIRETIAERSEMTPFDDRATSEAGFGFGVWNGATEGVEISLSVVAGSFVQANILNSCVLSPYGDPELPRTFLNVRLLVEVLKSLAKACEPDWATVSTYHHRDRLDMPFGAPEIGWLTYFSDRRGRLPKLPFPSYEVPVDDLGSILVLSDELFEDERAETVGMVDSIHGVLRRAGVLAPI